MNKKISDLLDGYQDDSVEPAGPTPPLVRPDQGADYETNFTKTK